MHIALPAGASRRARAPGCVRHRSRGASRLSRARMLPSGRRRATALPSLSTRLGGLEGRRRRRRDRGWSGAAGGSRIGRGRRVTDRRRRRRDRRLCRQEAERIDVSLRIGRDPHAEVDVGLRMLGVSGRPHGPDHGLLRDLFPAPHRVRAQADERDRVSVRGRDRDRLAARRNRPREGHRARDGRRHWASRVRADVDPAVLSRAIGVAAVEREERQHRPVDGPAPAQRGRRRGQDGGDEGYGQQQSHPGLTSVVRNANAETR